MLATAEKLVAPPAERERNPAPRFKCSLAWTPDEVLESQQLRYRVFAEEMGASIDGGRLKVDRDHYDSFCHHMLVRDTSTGEVVASTRILTDAQAKAAGGFYSENEFDLRPIMALPGRKMEIGRTCVHADYRSGAVIAVLWSGVAEYITQRGFDYLFGCASVELNDGVSRAHAIALTLQEKYSVENVRVEPRLALPASDLPLPPNPRMPPLLKAYVSLGAKACGAPCWDPDFGVADILMLLQVEDLCPRYARHFFQRSPEAQRPDPAAHSR